MENDNKLKNKNVETFTDDMVRALEGNKEGLIKKIIHEEEEHEALKENLSPESKKNKLFMLISVFLIFLAVTILIFFFFNRDINTVSVNLQAGSLIFTDKTDFKAIDGLTKEKIEDLVFTQVKNTKVKMGGVESIYLTEKEKIVGFERLISLIRNELILGKNFPISDNFLFGVISKETKDLFILLKVDSFADIFPVMRVWEKKILDDLHGFFGVDISSATNYLFTKDFEDGIVKNKNARILKGENGQIILMYVFIKRGFSSV